MRKILLLVIVLGMLFVPIICSATTFNFLSPVYVSEAETADGRILFKSADPANLDMIDGVVQFSNDVIKGQGRGMVKNAWRSARRINPNLLEVQLYKSTLQTQFAFNAKHGSRWGLIPSCAFVPDGKSVIAEISGPSRDSEDGKGGYHFSLVAHLKDPSLYKAVAMPPCPEKGDKVVIPTASSAVKPIEERDLAPETVDKKSTALAAAAAVSTAPAVKKPKVEKRKADAGANKKGDCDPCVEIVRVKADTEAIQSSVDDLKKAIGNPASDEENVMGVLKDIQKKVTPPPPAPIKKPALLEKKREWFWPYWIVGTLVVAFLMYWIGEVIKGSQPNVSATPNPPPATQPEEDEEVIPLTEPADQEEDKEPPHFV